MGEEETRKADRIERLCTFGDTIRIGLARPFRCRLGRGPHGKIPTGKHQDPRMAPQRSRKDLCPFNAETESIVFDGGKGCLGNACERRQLFLTQLLMLTTDADRFSSGDGNPLFRRAIFFHLKPPKFMCLYRLD